MKVLTMQLNSITIMDIVAYGGAALGIVVALLQYRGGHTGFGGCLLIILLSADFFLPMRQLGSFFHIAMNGMAASGKIFRLLELKEEPQEKKQEIPDTEALIRLDEVCFSYEPGREILHDISMELKPGSFTAIVGESGSGKSTLASVLTGQNKRRKGTLTIGGVDFDDISEESRMRHITYVSHNSYLFGGTVRDNLLMAKPDASEEELWRVLEQTKLSDFLKSEQGLDTVLTAQASNLSGGQRQRLALARALLHDSPVYLFDEATSNIDVESENDIMEQIIGAGTKKDRDRDLTPACEYGNRRPDLCACGRKTGRAGHTRKAAGKAWRVRVTLEYTAGIGAYKKGGDGMKKRSNITVMAKLIGLVRPLTRIYDPCHFPWTARTSLRVFAYRFWRLCAAWHRRCLQSSDRFCFYPASGVCICAWIFALRGTVL